MFYWFIKPNKVWRCQQQSFLIHSDVWWSSAVFTAVVHFMNTSIYAQTWLIAEILPGMRLLSWSSGCKVLVLPPQGAAHVNSSPVFGPNFKCSRARIFPGCPAACSAPTWALKAPYHPEPALADPDGHQSGAATGVSTAALRLQEPSGCAGVCGLWELWEVMLWHSSVLPHTATQDLVSSIRQKVLQGHTQYLCNTKICGLLSYKPVWCFLK